MGGVLRVVLIAGALAVAAGAGLFAVRRHVVLVSGVRVTVETRSATNAVCRVAWTTPENRAFAPAQSLDVSVPAGGGAVRVDLPVRSRLTGLRVTAPGVSLGRVTAVGNRRVLRCDTPDDIPEKLNLPAARLPCWRKNGRNGK